MNAVGVDVASDMGPMVSRQIGLYVVKMWLPVLNAPLTLWVGFSCSGGADLCPIQKHKENSPGASPSELAGVNYCSG